MPSRSSTVQQAHREAEAALGSFGYANVSTRRAYVVWKLAERAERLRASERKRKAREARWAAIAAGDLEPLSTSEADWHEVARVPERGPVPTVADALYEERKRRGPKPRLREVAA